MRYPIWEDAPPEDRFQELDEDHKNIPSGSKQSSPKLNNAPQHPEGDDNHLKQLDDFYSLEMLFDEDQKREFTPLPDYNMLVGNSLVACRVMRPVQFPQLFAPYTRLLASADQPRNLEPLLDVD
ncbi:hypothetical protein L218DRAFT_490763 [Marasmius fiardii PR-910]|nr:hypothetical protein L218DRAFT_490763 [Marasmius fiardii PR-910]